MDSKKDVDEWLDKITPKTRKFMKNRPDEYISFIMHYGEDSSVSVEWQPRLNNGKGGWADVG